MNPHETDLSTADVQQLIALIYNDWDAINPYAASYLYALDVNDCHELDDPVGNERRTSSSATSSRTPPHGAGRRLALSRRSCGAGSVAS